MFKIKVYKIKTLPHVNDLMRQRTAAHFTIFNVQVKRLEQYEIAITKDPHEIS